MGDWKLVLGGNLQDDFDGGSPKKGKKGTKAGDAVELFNLANDPSEKTNLAAQQPERVRNMRARLEAYAQQAVPPRVAPKGKNFASPKVWGEPE
jgi:hypothetical protein